MAREYRTFSREEKIKAVKMVLIDKKSQMEVERTVLGKKKCTGTINRWIREYIQEGEENCFKKRKGLKKVRTFYFVYKFIKSVLTGLFLFLNCYFLSIISTNQASLKCISIISSNYIFYII